MKDLFNSNGDHIAHFIDNHLYNLKGKNIGHYIESQDIFIGMDGFYIGEIYNQDRLLYNTSSPFKNTPLGILGDMGNMGIYGESSTYSMDVPFGYEDINKEKLK